jgi:uncharacterized membrane protein YfcA
MSVSWLPDAPWYVFVLISCVLVAAYTVFGATGFGSSIITVPTLAHWFPLTFVVPLITALDCVATANAGVRQWRVADWRELKRLLPGIVIGVAAGATLLVRLPRGVLLLALGLFVAGYGAYLFVGPRQWRAARSFWAWPIGVAGGAVSVMFGTGGPIYMLYLASRIHDKTTLRATSSLLVLASVFLRTGVFIATGLLLDVPLLVMAAAMVPLMFAGYALGNRLHFTLSRAGVLKLIAMLLMVNGVSLMARALALMEER